MRLISWNVNGLRAAVKKGFMESFAALDADIFCLQETKLQGRADRARPARVQPVLVLRGQEGVFRHGRLHPHGARVRQLQHRQWTSTTMRGALYTAEFEEFYLVCCYTPELPGRAQAPSATGMSWRTPSATTSWSWTRTSRS